MRQEKENKNQEEGKMKGTREKIYDDKDRAFWAAFGKYHTTKSCIDMNKINQELAKKEYPKREKKTISIVF